MNEPKPKDENAPEANDDTVPDEEKETVTQQDKSEKTFTQTELDRIVQARLRKEKETSKTQVDALSADVTFYETQMTKVIEAQVADWDEGMKLLFNALPVKERLEKLTDETFMASVRRKNIPPETPKNDGKPQSGGFTRRSSV